MTFSLHRWNGSLLKLLVGAGTDWSPGATGYDYTDGSEPWRYTSSTQAAKEAEFLAGYTAYQSATSAGSMPPIVNLGATGATFRDRVLNTLSANGRCIIRLPAGVFHLTSFVQASTINFCYGLWHTNLGGFVGAGADQTFIQMDADSLTADQLTHISGLTRASGTVLGINTMRIDGEQSSPAVLCGVTIQAADQQLVSLAADNSVANNQPAPHGGVLFYPRGSSTVVYFYQSHVRYRAAARACTSLPPFELENWSSSKGYSHVLHTESDGRLAPDIDPAQPRRCGPVAVNSEYVSLMDHCWCHHTNVSRYAANDQNASIAGSYLVRFSKFDHITDNQNTDPALNGGASLGGYTNATLMGWETSNADITVHDCILEVSNTTASGQVPCHFQLTTVSGARGVNGPQGGRFTAYNNTYRHAISHLDGFETRRIADDTYWYLDGLATTIDSRDAAGGTPKTAWTYTGSRFATSAEAAALNPSTRYIANIV